MNEPTWDEGPDWYQQYDNEARRWQEEQALLLADEFYQQWLDSLKEVEDGTLCE